LTASSDSASAQLPTQQGPRGLRFDFNDGCRVLLPESAHPWRVRLSDLDTGNVLFETEIKAGQINSAKRYHVRFRVEAWQQDERVFLHDYCAACSGPQGRACPEPGPAGKSGSLGFYDPYRDPETRFAVR
jgi:hypothetical protein